MRRTALKAAIGLALIGATAAPAMAQDWGWRGDPRFDRRWDDRGWQGGWDRGRGDDRGWGGGWDRRDDWRWRERFARFADVNRDGFVSRREYWWARERLRRGGRYW